MTAIVRKHVIFWLSKIVFKNSSPNIKTSFRQLEKNSIKLTNVKVHRLFNEACLNVYMYIYMYMFMYIYIYIYIYVYVYMYMFMYMYMIM